MSEVRLPAPVKARFVGEGEFYDEQLRARVPGSIWIDDETGRWLYACPCGCGSSGGLRVGDGHKPTGPGASWQWNGSLAAPTLHPSVHHVGHWHGWLRAGYWEQA